MRKEKTIESLGVTVKELTVKEIANLLDADEKDILSMIFGGGEVKTPDISGDSFREKLDFFCKACVGRSLENLINECFREGWTPSGMIELWEAFIEVNRPLAGLPKMFGIDGQAIKDLMRKAGPRLLMDLRAVSPELFERGTVTPGATG